MNHDCPSNARRTLSKLTGWKILETERLRAIRLGIRTRSHGSCARRVLESLGLRIPSKSCSDFIALLTYTLKVNDQIWIWEDENCTGTLLTNQWGPYQCREHHPDAKSWSYVEFPWTG